MNEFNINDIVKYPAKLGHHGELRGKIVGIGTNVKFDFYQNPYVLVEIFDKNLKRRISLASHKLTLLEKA